MPLRASIPTALFGALLAMPPAASSLEAVTQGSRAGSLNDRSAFEAFVQLRPTPEEFEQAYPDLWLILPGDIVTREVCSQYYRFIAVLDADGRITGGSLE